MPAGSVAPLPPVPVGAGEAGLGVTAGGSATSVAGGAGAATAAGSAAGAALLSAGDQGSTTGSWYSGAGSPIGRLGLPHPTAEVSATIVSRCFKEPSPRPARPAQDLQTRGRDQHPRRRPAQMIYRHRGAGRAASVRQACARAGEQHLYRPRARPEHAAVPAGSRACRQAVADRSVLSGNRRDRTPKVATQSCRACSRKPALLVDRAQRGFDVEARRVAQLGFGFGVVHHTNVADEVELGSRK